ncbi:hypothetical protein LZ31DRAFT_553818 [Colletotrichum somersetense]|nr:hypothetical protein LZ31DRAFT_553818 [Colletotrichum somersetense]
MERYHYASTRGWEYMSTNRRCITLGGFAWFVHCWGLIGKYCVGFGKERKLSWDRMRNFGGY